ncbi:hypothetical protein GQ53DRAFT_725607 [Thozetella sp. PMI_491]|nr:hypothetical protein GQ53DRAFT_725607 [Thozetella sp. PMI_491]
MSRRRFVLLACCAAAITFLLLRPANWPTTAIAYYGKSSGPLLTEALNSTLGKILVINLPSRTDRRDAMTLAAALTGLQVGWINGRDGKDLDDRVLPADSRNRSILVGNKGSWRAHMDALQMHVSNDLCCLVIHENLTSALILEDDADWDIRLGRQMQDLTRLTQAYIQPLQANPQRTNIEISREIEPRVFDPAINEIPGTVSPATSPFGDGWDVLWLGHCGTEFPAPSAVPRDGDKVGPGLPLLRVVRYLDETVPMRKHLKPHPLALEDQLASAYPDHTRVVHASNGTICTIGYAVSQQGARKLLWQFGLETFTTGWDLMLRDWCNHGYENRFYADGDAQEKAGRGRERAAIGNAPVCLTVQPPLFSHHFGKSGGSDITAPGGGFISKGRESTPYIRLSVRLNMGRLVRGSGVEDLVDQWPDETAQL